MLGTLEMTFEQAAAIEDLKDSLKGIDTIYYFTRSIKGNVYTVSFFVTLSFLGGSPCTINEQIAKVLDIPLTNGFLTTGLKVKGSNDFIGSKVIEALSVALYGRTNAFKSHMI